MTEETLARIIMAGKKYTSALAEHRRLTDEIELADSRHHEEIMELKSKQYAEINAISKARSAIEFGEWLSLPNIISGEKP
jgi:hypothetical protein